MIAIFQQCKLLRRQLPHPAVPEVKAIPHTKLRHHALRVAAPSKPAGNITDQLLPVGKHPNLINGMNHSLAQTFHAHTFCSAPLEHGDIEGQPVVIR